jgi:glycosyltransferase involved in cell wall biosynthesis
MVPESVRISVIVPTRNRGKGPIETVRSVLANAHADFELIVIDQSESDDTKQALSEFESDQRYRHVMSTEIGASRGRNQGVRLSRSDVLLFTDDDCVVPSNWIATMEQKVLVHPGPNAVFCEVDAAPNPPGPGYTPVFRPTSEMVMRRPLDNAKAICMSAGLAMRRETLVRMGGFDPLLGPGSIHFMGEDTDLAMRVVLLGGVVVATPDVAVVHHGWRGSVEAQRLIQRGWYSIGACYGKYLRANRWRVLGALAYQGIASLRSPLLDLAHGRPPRGLRAPLYLARGFAASLGRPVDKTTLLFQV